jgi:hypothetical protein
MNTHEIEKDERMNYRAADREDSYIKYIKYIHVS